MNEQFAVMIAGISPEQFNAIQVQIADEELKSLNDVIAEYQGMKSLIDQLQGMLYHMTSLRDWMAEGYSIEDYNAFREGYENSSSTRIDSDS